MRIVGGAWRGRRFAAPAGRATRPTSDRVREAIFDVLGAMALAAQTDPDAPGPVAPGAVLDLFAGSGALGLEALSRGAATCAFVERAPGAVRVLRANLATFEVDAAVGRVNATDYRRALKADAARARLYTLVLIDAPYALYPAVELELAGRLPDVLASGAVVVVETARDRGGRSAAARARGQAVRRHTGHFPASEVLSVPSNVTAICPGTFDPVTVGHLDIITRGARAFGRVIVGLIDDPTRKQTLFTSAERLVFLRDALADYPNVHVDHFNELVVEFALRWDAKVILKGLRAISDFEYEFAMAQLNRKLAPDIETVFDDGFARAQLPEFERRKRDRHVRRVGRRSGATGSGPTHRRTVPAKGVSASRRGRSPHGCAGSDRQVGRPHSQRALGPADRQRHDRS